MSKVYQFIINIPALVKIYYALKYLNKYKKQIKEARANGDSITERKYILKATTTWSKYLLKYIGATLHVTGKENLPKEGPVVYIANHQSFSDIPLLCNVLDTVQTGFIAKDSLSKVPLYGEWIDLVRSVYINRENPRESVKAINKGVDYIKNGYSLVIFPEGTRSQAAEIGEFKKGSTKLATKPGVPIVPITLHGTYKLFERQGYNTPADIGVIIHPPIETANLTREEEGALTERLQEIVEGGLDELVKKYGA